MISRAHNSRYHIFIIISGIFRTQWNIRRHICHKRHDYRRCSQQWHNEGLSLVKLSWSSVDFKWQLLIDVASFNHVLMKIQVSIFCCFYSLHFLEVTFEWQLEILIPKISQYTQENTRSRVHSMTSPPPMISEEFWETFRKIKQQSASSVSVVNFKHVAPSWEGVQSCYSEFKFTIV